MVGTIMLGEIFKTPTSSHRAGFTRSYSHRVIIRKISSNALVPIKTWLPNRVYIFKTVALLQHDLSISLSPIREHQVTDHLQAEIINSQLSIFKTRSDSTITRT